MFVQLKLERSNSFHFFPCTLRSYVVAFFGIIILIILLSREPLTERRRKHETKRQRLRQWLDKERYNIELKGNHLHV